MTETYSKYIEYFFQKTMPKQILSNNIINEYLNSNKELPKIYKDIEKEYSQINISSTNEDIISMIYWDMPFLSDEFICYCLPMLIPKSIEYADVVLLNQLKKMDFDKLSKNDSDEIKQLINTIESDKIFIEY